MRVVKNIALPVILGAGVIFSAPSHAALDLLSPNGTLTIIEDGVVTSFQASDSEYDLVTDGFPGGEPVVNANELPGPGGESVFATKYDITIPNFFDPLPEKTITVEMVGVPGDGYNTLLQPAVLGIFGADSPFDEIGPATPVFGEFQGSSSSNSGGTVTVVEDWLIATANPDFETLEIWVPTDFNLSSISIATQSVPVPAAVWLLGSALIGLVGVARRKSAV